MKNQAKEIAIENYEPQEQVIIPQSTREELEYNLINRNIRMSYSKLKNLTSPVNFMNALLEPKTKNAGMVEGSLADTLLFEEHKFNDRYKIVTDMPSETSDNQKGYVKDTLNYLKQGLTFDTAKENAFELNYKKGKLSDLEKLDDYILTLHSGKECASQEMYDKYLAITYNLKNVPEIQDELSQAISFQKKIGFEYLGWKFVSVLDLEADYGFLDAKKTKACDTDEFGRELFKLGYDVQLGLYKLGMQITGMNNNPQAKYLLFDDKFNYNLPSVGEDLMNHSVKKVEFLVSLLNKMVDERAFNASYGYLKSKNTIYKPKYIAGFDYEIFND